MRSFATPFPVRVSIGLAATVWAAVAGAQVNDGQRAVARELFKQGDELQRAGHFAEALDKFQRAEQVFAAPTNELRVAECEAALGQLVESGEAYRLVVRAVLPPGSPPAFQAAVDQAKAEFEQVDPRIPRLVVQVLPAAANVRLQLDGQSVPSALLGQPMPLDPGPHKASAIAPGYAGAEQSLVLKERETRVIQLVLKQVATTSVTPSPAPVETSVALSSGGPPAASSQAPPPPPVAPQMPAPESATPEAPHESRFGLLLGGHLGLELVGGTLPPDENNPDATSVDPGTVAGAGVAFGLDGGFRFGRRWYVGATLEHAAFSSTVTDGGTSRADTTLAALVIALIVNPNRVSFYGEVGLGSRWFHYAIAGSAVDTLRQTGEFSLGSGVWIPIGRSFRLLPKATLGLGGFDSDNGATAYAHVFFMLGTAGFYNADF
jgi:hypothetical protein